MIEMIHIIARTFMLFVALLCVATAKASESNDDVTPFPYVFMLEDGRFTPAEISDSDFYSHSESVIFPVNKYNIPSDSKLLRELKEKVEPWASQQGYELTYVEMRGGSSPEGNIPWNNTLAKNRSRALRDTLRNIFVVGYDILNPKIKQNPEDYKALVHMMRQKNDADLTLVENILKDNAGNRSKIKAEMKRAKGGALWNRLLKEYFPDIRYARILLYFAPKQNTQYDFKLPYNIQLADEEAYRHLHEKYPYVFILPPGETKIPELSDNFYYNYGQGIKFPVNKFNLPKNDKWLDELNREVEPWANANNMKLRHVSMRGASSPEGSLKWNDILAENRSKALQDTLQSIFHIDYEIVDSHVMQAPEDYKALVHLMNKEKDPDLKTVENILKQNKWDRVNVKKALKKVNNGKLWNRLLHEYFPEIRYARVYLFFSKDLENESAIIGTSVTDSISKGTDSIGRVTPTITKPLIDRIPRRRVLALRTNLLYDGLYMPNYGWAPSPNLAVEYFPANGHFTYNAEITYPDWENYSNHHFWQIHDYNLSVRYYTRRTKVAPADGGDYAFLATDYYQGLFLAAYLNAGRYGIGFNNHKGWEGEYFGGGMQIGYTMPLTKSHRWRLEFSASLGCLMSKYDPYVYGNPISGEEDGKYYYDWNHSAEFFIKRNHRFTWLGPTGLGIHLTYDLLYRNQYKKGVSTSRWETAIVPVPVTKKAQDSTVVQYPLKQVLQNLPKVTPAPTKQPAAKQATAPAKLQPVQPAAKQAATQAKQAPAKQAVKTATQTPAKLQPVQPAAPAKNTAPQNWDSWIPAEH